jgi:ribosomal protein S19
MWQCDPPDDTGHTHSVYGGKTFPQVTVTEKRTLGAVEKLRGVKLSRSSVDATWTLVNYVESTF